MTTLHTRTASAVLTTRRHVPVVPVRAEKSGAVSGRGCAHGTGRRRPRHGGAVDASRAATAAQNPVGYRDARGGTLAQALGEGLGEHRDREVAGNAYGEASGERRRDAARSTAAVADAEFTAYVRERRASLYATAFHLTGDRHEAEDLLQNALFSTYRAWGRISDKAAVGGYLRRTMTNLHISAWRRRRLTEYPTEELPETPQDHDAMRGTELRTVLWQAMARLPETQRTMLVLRYYEGRTDLEIADILGISVGTVKSSIWRSLRRLRQDQALSRGRDQQETFGELVA